MPRPGSQVVYSSPCPNCSKDGLGDGMIEEKCPVCYGQKISYLKAKIVERNGKTIDTLEKKKTFEKGFYNKNKSHF